MKFINIFKLYYIQREHVISYSQEQIFTGLFSLRAPTTTENMTTYVRHNNVVFKHLLDTRVGLIQRLCWINA